MIKERYIWDEDKKELVPFSGQCRPMELHYVQGDEIPPTVSHATDEGRVFTSRTALNRHYKAHGFECTGGEHLRDYGINDHKYQSNKEEIMNDIRETKRALEWGEVPLTEREKETCHREERAYRDYCRSQRGR